MSQSSTRRTADGRRRITTVGALSLVVSLAMVLSAAVAQSAGETAQASWDFVVCADPHAMPLSHRSESGYENAIAAVLADEMGARLVFDWYPQMQDMINLRLRDGFCDVIMGVPDGTPPLLTTIAYYTSPYVFVYRADSGFELGSLDDPVLADLEIGLQNAGMPPHDSLISRGLAENVTAEYGESRYAPVDDPQSRLVEAVLAGEVDVGISWGPPAGYYAALHEEELVVVPIEPAIDPNPPFTPMQLPMTIGVRQGDEALRDRLNTAIVGRWQEIQTILGEYSVPLVRGTAPPSPPMEADRRAVGFVAPTASGALTAPRAAVHDIVGAAAKAGALMAEDDASRELAPEMDVLFANSPSPQAAERAARRLVDLEGAEVLVGGLGEGQAATLATVAEELGVPFLNVAEDDPALRCGGSFSVAPSGDMYAVATAEWFGDQGVTRWHVVRLEGAPWEAIAEAFTGAVSARGGLVTGETVVTEAQPLYTEAMVAAGDEDADAVFLLVEGADQIAFLAQAVGTELRLVAYPGEVTLSRDFLAAARRLSRRVGGERIVPWETTITTGSAGRLNERFTSRFGSPMDPHAWTAYAGITLLARALSDTGDLSVGGLAEYLLANEFDLAKDAPLAFDDRTRQLRQPLYVIRAADGSEWGPSLSQQLSVAELVGEVRPESAVRTCE